jgi:hypothetical protein
VNPHQILSPVLIVAMALPSVATAADAPPATAAAAQKKQLIDSFAAARFLGQCQAVSELYLQAQLPKDVTDKLKLFVVEKVYGKDARYRFAVPDTSGHDISPAMDEVLKFRENQSKEKQYWADCDAVTAKFKEIFEQLKVVP